MPAPTGITSSARRALSGLHGRRPGWRPLCRPARRNLAGAAAGPLPRLCPARVRDKRRFRRRARRVAVHARWFRETPKATCASPNAGSARSRPAGTSKRPRTILGRDFLSPLAAAGLFPDFLQRFSRSRLSVRPRARHRGVVRAGVGRDGAGSKGNPFAESFYEPVEGRTASRRR